MNEEGNEAFIEIEQDKVIMGEEKAREIYEKISMKNQRSEDVIKQLRELTNLSIRGIASITGLNKDKVNKILRM